MAESLGEDAIHYSGAVQELRSPGPQPTELCWPQSSCLLTQLQRKKKNLPQRCAQRPVSWAILGSVKLTVNINY